MENETLGKMDGLLSDQGENMEKLKEAVNICNVYKSYGNSRNRSRVLNGLNITLTEGSIYALLGPSGCGKTTILRCVLGRLSYDRGTITVLGEAPKDVYSENGPLKVGYMPQDISLVDKLTVMETLIFFGTICRLEPDDIEKRANFLLDLLNLEMPNKLISQLSGGQKRRVSFAVALLHQPEILILDEPTVGVDPVLRKNIWNYLTTLVKDKNKPITIIITTHYIEEARKADVVGMMMNGEILLQAPPESLIKEYGCTSLEQVFLKLCLERNSELEEDDASKDFSVSKDEETGLKETRNKKFQEIDSNYKSKKKDNLCSRIGREMPKWYRVQALIKKNLLFFIRNITMLVFEIILPPIVMVLFGVAVGKPLFGISVGVVNHDSRGLANDYLENVNQKIIGQVPYTNFEDAEIAARSGHIMGIVYFNPNFSEGITLRLQDAGLVSDFALNASAVSMSLDFSSPQMAFSIQQELLVAFQKFAKNLSMQLGVNPMIAELPFKYAKEQVYGNFEFGFDQLLFCGFIICVTFFMAFGSTAIAMVSEFGSGSVERVNISGVLAIEVILGYIMSHILIIIVQIPLTISTAFIFYGYTCEGSYLLIGLLCFMQALCGFGMGILIATTLVKDNVTLLMCVAIWCFCMCAEGFLWPIEGMSEFLKTLSRLLPQTLSVEAIRSIVNRGWDIYHPQIYYALVVTATWTAIFLILSWVVSRRKM